MTCSRWSEIVVLCLAVAGCSTANPPMDGSADASTTGTPLPSTSGAAGSDQGEATGSSSEPHATTTSGSGPGDSTGDPEEPLPSGPRTVYVHLFEWPWAAIARECEDVLGPAGYAAAQVSPPQEYGLVEGAPWWERYQPVAYQLAGRSGDEVAFTDMVSRCRAVGVEIYVDAVLNHMAFAPGGIGVAGTSFTKYDYPGLYIDADFHQCKHGIEDYGSRYEIQSCELATLPDLATESDYVRDRLTDYLQHLVDLGVGGFRIDAAKHIPADDLRIITDGLDRPVFLFGEVINLSPSEVVSFAEYTDFAKVTEFRYSLELSRVFREGQVAWLEQFGEVWEMMPSADAVVFVDNHDNQRGHAAGDPITHGSPELYRLANIFMLAWPYGYPQVMSSYAFSDADEGPPLHPSGGVLPPHTASGECVDPWVCEHRWPAIRNMVGFRNATTDAPGIEHWWTNGANQIAFSRGDRGFVMINREGAAASARAFETGLPAGMYCDVVSGAIDPAHRSCSGLVIEVDTAGRAIFEVGALDAVAIHVESRIAE